jgi:hypothetical protein
MAYDAARDRVVLFGGTAAAGYDDTWEWDGARWTPVAPSGVVPLARKGHAMVYDAARGRVVLFGGSLWPNLFNDAWEWHGTAWSRLSPPTEAPPPQSSHALAYHGGVGRLVSLGDVYSGDTWQLGWIGTAPVETCAHGFDADGDGLIGCADPDCWGRCTPHCPPGAPCNTADPRCGDGQCNAMLESCRLCPSDCGACPAACGDHLCDLGETKANCPGDC